MLHKAGTVERNNLCQHNGHCLLASLSVMNMKSSDFAKDILKHYMLKHLSFMYLFPLA